MKSVLKILTPVLFMGFFLPGLAFAQSLSLPHQFFGSVGFTNGAAPNGLAVEARISGSVSAVGSSVTAGGNYGYNPNLLFALDNDGAFAGKTVEFYVDGVKANETAVFANGNSSQLNLTVPVSLPTTPSPTPNPTPAGSGGGGGGGIIPTTPTASLSAAAQKVDANKDGKIDVLDFNILMVNWGNASVGNVADFNGDNLVDILDFNSLMVYWTV